MCVCVYFALYRKIPLSDDNGDVRFIILLVARKVTCNFSFGLICHLGERVQSEISTLCQRQTICETTLQVSVAKREEKEIRQRASIYYLILRCGKRIPLFVTRYQSPW